MTYDETKEPDRWISVSDRLPEPYTQVLVYSESRLIGIPFIVSAELLDAVDSDGTKSLVWAWIHPSDKEHLSFYEEPTHWQPLKPPAVK